MIKRYLYPEGRLDFRVVLAWSLAILSGLSAAFLAIVVNEAAGEIVEGRAHLKHLPFFIVGLAVFIVSRRFGLRQGIERVEEILEKQRNQIGNLIRQTQLLSLEKMDPEEIYYKTTLNTQIISVAAQSIIRALQSLVTILLIFTYVFHLSKGIGVLFFMLFALGVFFHKSNRTGLEKKNLESMSLDEALFERFGEVIDGFKELKLKSGKKTDFIRATLMPADEAARSSRIALGEIRAKYDTLSFIFLFYISLGAVAFLLPSHTVLAIKFKIITASAFLWEPISALSLAIPEILKANAAADELKALERWFMPVEGVMESLHDPETEFIDPPREFRLSRIRFDYPGKNGEGVFRVGPVDFSIYMGEMVFIAGGNGSGKSTFLKVLAGLYPPLSGSFSIDGSEIDISEHGYLFSAVFSDFHLFDELYGIDPPDEKRVAALLNQMGLDHVVQWTGERFLHNGLSSGQMKRLGLITAILEDKPIYLFDEWAAEQDPVFKKIFYETLLPELKSKGKTIIAVTHDERYFHIADRLITFSYGQISHEGPYDPETCEKGWS